MQMMNGSFQFFRHADFAATLVAFGIPADVFWPYFTGVVLLLIANKDYQGRAAATARARQGRCRSGVCSLRCRWECSGRSTWLTRPTSRKRFHPGCRRTYFGPIWWALL